MNFNLCRHIRIAGSITIMVGAALSNWTVIVLGNVAVCISYMVSIAKIEQIIERGTDCKIETEDKEL